MLFLKSIFILQIRKFRYVPLPYKDQQLRQLQEDTPEVVREEIEEQNVSESCTLKESQDDINEVTVENDPAEEFVSLDDDDEEEVEVVEAQEEVIQIGLPAIAPVTEVVPQEVDTSKEENSHEVQESEDILKYFSKETFALPIQPGDIVMNAEQLVAKYQELPTTHDTCNKDEENDSVSETVSNLFSRFSDLITESSSRLFDTTANTFNVSYAIKTIEKINRKVRSVVSEEMQHLAETAEDILISKWNDVQKLTESDTFKKHEETTRVAMDKLGKTLVAALNKFKKSAVREGLPEAWEQIQSGLQEKWQKVLAKFDRIVKKAEAKEKARKMKEEKELGKQEVAQVYEDPLIVSETESEYSQWSYKSMEDEVVKKNTSDWVFGRAQNRRDSRRDQVKSDWLFERARDRKRFHDFGKAEWHSKRLFNKKCDDDDDCEDFGKVKNLFLQIQ